jgi:hypothetical protein
LKGQNPEEIDGKKALETTRKVLKEMLGDPQSLEKEAVENVAQSLKDTGAYPSKETAAAIAQLFKEAYEKGGPQGAGAMETRINKALEHVALPLIRLDVKRNLLGQALDPDNSNEKFLVFVRKDGQILIEPGSLEPVSIRFEAESEKSRRN